MWNFSLFNDFIGLLFPNLCCGCGLSLYKGEQQICSKCLFELPYTDYHLYAENKAAKQLWGRIPCQAVFALLYFKKGSRVQNLIHHLKYKGRQDLGIKLGRMIGEKIKDHESYATIDLIIPVPLHPARQRSRGYNQSHCIAEGIAAVLQKPINKKILLRKINTSSQTRKNRFIRFENMQTVFFIHQSALLKKQHILLVDDVLTTGATLEACGIELFNAGVSKLSIATVAFAD